MSGGGGDSGKGWDESGEVGWWGDSGEVGWVGVGVIVGRGGVSGEVGWWGDSGMGWSDSGVG